MSDHRFMSEDGHCYIRLPSEPAITERQWIFDELPTAKIVAASRPDAGDITPLLLSYTIEFQYKQFRWHLLKKASQVLYLHLALKKRAFLEELHDKQEQCFDEEEKKDEEEGVVEEQRRKKKKEEEEMKQR
ncbi:hypothetical protein C4D60_Mb09t15040 [Musa balbisiana]|uniref:Uncharacterized protein n=1 Tax=Musa balbisiana TaxID=52838 RepID=A0A4V6T415_MUSBA|nr:hypothetical protein C4D60_Mb09t15040 [Musa balbisiana]